MKINAILVARVLGFIETADLNRSGKVWYPTVVNGLVNAFGFQKWPQKLEDMDETKGINFEAGIWDGTPIEKFTIFNTGFLIETLVSTMESERILEEALLWGAKEFGLSYAHGDIKRKRYVSDLVVTTEVPLLDAYAPVRNATAAVSEHVSRIVGKSLPYYGVRMDLDIERNPLAIPIAPFSIQRRADTPISENRYFCEAPLPTDVHIALLEQFEKDVAKSLTK